MDFLFKALKTEGQIQNAVSALQKALQNYGVVMEHTPGKISCSKAGRSFEFLIATASFDYSQNGTAAFVTADNLITGQEKITGIVLSKLNLNNKIFARNCEVRKIDKHTAETFLNAWHLMGATQSGSNRGLFYENELQALASFSKGRKMNRLPGHQRSFELIRFCSRPGITVTGGLTKLLKNFFVEKEAGDIMTYVDKQLSDGKAFVSAGFKRHSETPPNYFLINKKTFERSVLKNKDEDFDQKTFYLAQNSGNIKMIYQPLERL